MTTNGYAEYSLKLQQMIGADTYLQYEEQMSSVHIEAGAMRRIVGYLEEQQYTRVQLVADDMTYEVAGKHLERQIARAGIMATVTRVEANSNGDVIADEASIVQVLLDKQQCEAEVLIAVGGGTLHDIARYAAYTAKIGFLSVPTAPSVDGFNSIGAPIIVRGYKQTVISVGPDAVFADLDVLSQAPRPLIAAGMGDMLGKVTSLLDWHFGALVSDERYAADVACITREALRRCKARINQIARREEEGIADLMYGLMASGAAMRIFGHSHPASGAEHHLSHYWEMDHLKRGHKQLLHGAKVGCATIEIIQLYKRLRADNWGSSPSLPFAVRQHWPTVAEEIAALPEADEVRQCLQQVGGPASCEDLGISPRLLEQSLRKAHLVRPQRHTLLQAYCTSAR